MNIELNGLPVLLFVVFLTLKLTNAIAWSWWWVTSPLWIPPILAMALIVAALFVMLAAWAIEKIMGKKP